MVAPVEMLARIKAELAVDPMGRGYAGKSPQDQSALLNASYSVAQHPVTVDVPVSAVEGYLRSRMLMGGLVRFIPANPTSPLSEGLSELLGMLASPHVDTVRMTDPAVAAAVNAVLAGGLQAGLISAQNLADITALASIVPPPVEMHARVIDMSIGIAGAPNNVTSDDVSAAVA